MSYPPPFPPHAYEAAYYPVAALPPMALVFQTTTTTQPIQTTQQSLQPQIQQIHQPPPPNNHRKRAAEPLVEEQPGDTDHDDESSTDDEDEETQTGRGSTNKTKKRPNKKKQKKQQEQHSPLQPQGYHKRLKQCSDQEFQSVLELLHKYKQEFGHVNVPLNYQGSRRLANWVAHVKTGYIMITDAQRQILVNELGMDFETKYEKQERMWQEKFQALQAYQNEHQTTLVKEKHDKSLARWVGAERRKFQVGTMPDHHHAQLQTLNFDFEHGRDKDIRILPHQHKQWRIMYEKLQAFHKEHGHTNVGYSKINPNVPKERKQLAMWVAGQRSQEQKGLLLEDRKAQLDALGFVWRKAKTSRNRCLEGKVRLLEAELKAGIQSLDMTAEAKPIKSNSELLSVVSELQDMATKLQTLLEKYN